jgi:MFS superfamily sulfate permease-like transporter
VVIAFTGGRPGMISAATGAMALLMGSYESAGLCVMFESEIHAQNPALISLSTALTASRSGSSGSWDSSNAWRTSASFSSAT